MLGLGDSPELLEEALAGIHHLQVHVVLVPEQPLHALLLSLAQKPVVHEHTVQPVTDRLVRKHRCHRGIHACGP